jgi:hypothetical protein
MYKNEAEVSFIEVQGILRLVCSAIDEKMTQ